MALDAQENELLSSDEESTTKQITLESVIEECGAFARYQYIHTFFLLFFPVASGIFNYYFIFAAAEPPFSCQRPGQAENESYIEVLSSQCSYVKRDVYNTTVETYPCTSWVYGQHVFGRTFTEEADLICDRSIQRSFLSTALQMGAMCIFFTGQVTDLIGRRRSMHLLVALLVTTSIVTQSIMQFVHIPIKLKYATRFCTDQRHDALPEHLRQFILLSFRFVLLLINQFVSGIDTFMISFLLLVELTSAKYTNLVGNLALLACVLGEIVVTSMAYLCRHWLLLKWAMTLYMLALVPYLFFLPESPRWLLSKHRYDDLEKLLRRIARWNRRPNSRWLPLYRYMIATHQREKDTHTKNKVQMSFTAKATRVLTHVPTMSKLVISAVIGFVTLLIYLKISYSLGAMDEIDPYLNLVLGAGGEALGYLAPCLLMIRFGRKPIFITFQVLTAICLVATPYSHHYSRFIVVLVAQLGKFAISGAVAVTYIFVPELFPTTIRGTGMGFFILFSRIGATSAPMIDAWINRDRSSVVAMYYLYALFTLLTALLGLLLPETRNVPLADKIDYSSRRKTETSNRT